ncbi:MerR family transcriptional regulator [bacterium]|nr:MerR family transcriptional regulator [bacterium]
MNSSTQRQITKQIPESKNPGVADFMRSLTYQHYSSTLNSHIGGVKITSISYRRISHWAKKGILTYTHLKKESGWKTFTARELIWIRIIEELRKMEVSIPMIGRIYKDIFGDPKRTQLFDLYIMFSLTGNRIHLIVSQNGECEFANAQELNLYVDTGDFPTNYISIDLGSISRQILQHSNKKALPSLLVPLHDDEARLVESINEMANQTISVEIENGGIKRLIKARDNDELKQEIQALVTKYYPKGAWGEIEIKIKEGRADRVIESTSKKI